MPETPGILYPNLDSDGNTVVATGPLSGTEKYLYMPNLCDETTWYYNSTVVTDQSLTDSGDLTTWNSPHTNWIDLKHGKHYNEDKLIAATPTLAVKVEVDAGGVGSWVEKTENTWGTTDGDYDVDYAAGTVTFNSALGASDLVRASYHRKADSGGSKFIIKPDAGKRLKMVYVEVQYTEDVQMSADIIFQISGYVQVFAPALWDGNNPPGPYPTNTIIPLVTNRYKRLQDFYIESTGPFPVIPAHGGSWVLEEVVGLSNIQAKLAQGYHETGGWRFDGTDWRAVLKHMNTNDRALKNRLITVPFNYQAFRDLRSSFGLEVGIHIDGDTPFSGEFSNVTSYCLQEDET